MTYFDPTGIPMWDGDENEFKTCDDELIPLDIDEIIFVDDDSHEYDEIRK